MIDERLWRYRRAEFAADFLQRIIFYQWDTQSGAPHAGASSQRLKGRSCNLLGDRPDLINTCRL